MTAGRVVLVVLGCLVSLVGLPALAGGVALLVADHTQRDSVIYAGARRRRVAAESPAFSQG